MTATTTTPAATQQPVVTLAKPSRTRRSNAEEAEIVRAKKIENALPALLAGIAAKDANAAKVRIDQGWLDQYSSVIASAGASADGRTVARVNLQAATAEERASATQLAKLIVDVRDRVATHSPDDVNAQKAYGRGMKLKASRTGPTIALAGALLGAWDGQWQKVATDAGITQPEMDQIRALRDGLSQADMGQHGVISANTDGTLQRAALFAVLRSMSGFAARVVKNVFGKASSEALSVADPRPFTSRAAARKAATRAKANAKKAAAKAKKAAKPKKGAAVAKRRAKRSAVAARKAALTSLAGPKIAPKPAAKTKGKSAKGKS